MVVLGVGAEVVGDWFSEPYQKKLEDARKFEIANLTNENLKLQGQIAPRRLTPAEVAAAADALSNPELKGKTIAVVSYVLDIEGAALAQQILAALKAAGITTVYTTSSYIPSTFITFGVDVTASGSGSDTEKWTKLVREAFPAALFENSSTITLAGRPTGAVFMGSGVPHAPRDIAILVGAKPIATAAK